MRDRATGTLTVEHVSPLITFLYGTTVGRALLSTVVARPWFSRAGGWLCDTRLSALAIAPFARRVGIDMEPWAGVRFASFNEFFARSRLVTTEAGPREFIAVAESRLTAYPIEPELIVAVKGGPYTLDELTGGCPELERFEGGTCLVFRLGVDNYHRFIHGDAGRLISRVILPGEIRTVQPIAGNEGVYRRNTRAVSVMDTETFGRIIEVDVGATLVARIKDAGRSEFARLDEKGHFEFGASTVIVLVGPHVRIDEDILDASAKGIETSVCIGERIGEAI